MREYYTSLLERLKEIVNDEKRVKMFRKSITLARQCSKAKERLSYTNVHIITNYE